MVSKALVFGITLLFEQIAGDAGSCCPLQECDPTCCGRLSSHSCFLSCPNPKQALREMGIVVGCFCNTLQYNVAFFYMKYFRLS
jgi:hypothetical protein